MAELANVSMADLMAEVGRRLACSEKKAQNLVLVGEWEGPPVGSVLGATGPRALRRGGRRAAARARAAPPAKPPRSASHARPRRAPAGPPGCGKGTQSPAIKRDYCLCHLATGALACGQTAAARMTPAPPAASATAAAAPRSPP